MQVDDLVDQGGAGVEKDRHQRRVAAGWLQVAQVLSGHLPALTGELQQPVLVDRVFQPIWQPQFVQGPQPFQVGQHMLGLG